MDKESSFDQGKNIVSLYSDFFSASFLQATIKIFESIDEAVLIVDKSYIVKFINKSALRLLQINVGDVVDKNVCEAVSNDLGVIFKDLYKRLIVDGEQVATVKEYIPSLRDWVYIQGHSTSDGIAFLLRHKENKNQVAVMIEKYYQILFDNHPDPVCLIDLEDQMIAANSPFYEFCQVKADGVEGKKIYDFFPDSKQSKAKS